MVINVNDFDYNIEFLKLEKEKNKYKNKPDYADIVCAFDIETTNIDDIQQSIMYIWQFQIGLDITIIGRTWDEFKSFMNKLDDILDELTLVIYVHNLSFEWQWLKSILHIDKVFAMDDRKVLYFISNNFEFRCSYLHSNMNLDKFVEKMGAKHKKIKGFDYNKKRYSWTELSKRELLYCINDVLALVEAIYNEMEKDHDNLYSICYTSTGYVRREFKKVMIPMQKEIRKMLPDLEIFEGLRACFRGGNTHAHRGNAGRIIHNVYSYDISSSYPSVMLTEEYPTKFTKQDPKKLWLALKHNRACLMHIQLANVRLIDNNFGCPYLAVGKCNNIINALEDNGRILSCDSLNCWINEIDLKILLMEYDFDYEILKLYTAPKKKLPEAFRKLLFGMYEKKTLLKGGDDEYAYTKYKNMINSVYGMT